MTSAYPKHWLISGVEITSCSEAEWAEFRRNAENFVMAKTYIEPGFLVMTQFIGKQESPEQYPLLFETTIFGDLGWSSVYPDTWNDAAMRHTMECQRLRYIADLHNWAAYANLVDPQLPDHA